MFAFLCFLISCLAVVCVHMCAGVCMYICVFVCVHLCVDDYNIYLNVSLYLEGWISRLKNHI